VPIRIRRASAAEVVDLRHEVLRAGLPRETAIFPGDDAATSIHVFAVDDNGRAVGCGTLHLNEWQNKPSWQLRGMAVAPTHRGQAIGAQLLAALESAVAASDVHQLWCNARTPAAEFYRKHGWEIVSEPFEIPTAGPHVKMIKTISRSSTSR
jgi:predicted GNAT family N-acyltransferase